MLAISKLLKKTIKFGASDVHITVGLPPIMRVDGNLVPYGNDKFTSENTNIYVREILNQEQYKKYTQIGELDLSYDIQGVGRFRVNVFRQNGNDAIALRTIASQIPTLEKLGLQGALNDMCKRVKGLILVTGPTGSGKSTTLAAMVNEINSKRKSNIITLEDPIEYLHKHKKSIINQREIGYDSKSFASALRAVLREDPDVILVGEMRDLETISIAITAAETGHLVLSTLHTIGASNTIDRIVDGFYPHQQEQIRIQLAAVVEGIVSQQLLQRTDGRGRVVATEIMLATSGIKNLIREGKTHQIDSAIQIGGKHGMKTMDMSLVQLYKNGEISREDAITYSVDYDIITRYIDL